MRLRPTRTGLLVLVLAAATAGSGRSLRYPELTVAAAVLAAAIVTGAGWALLVNRPTAVTRDLRSDRVTDGEPAGGTVTVTRRRRWPVAATVVDAVDGRRVAAGGAGDQLSLPALPRGRYRLGPLVLVTTDPLGLVQVRRRAGGTDATLWVHPRVHPVRAHRAPGGRQPGVHLQVGAPQGIELHRLEDYVPGDDPRLIHWPTSLRRGSLVVRHPARDRHGDVLVVLDTAARSYTGGEQFEHAVRTAASIVLALMPEHESVGLATTGGLQVRIDASGRRRVELLDALAGVSRRAGDPDLSGFRPRSPHRSTLVAVSGSGGDGDGGTGTPAVVTQLSRHVDGLTLLQVGEVGSLARPRPSGGPAFEVISAPTSGELLDAWMARSAP